MKETGYSVFTSSFGVGGVVSSKSGLVEIFLPFAGLGESELRAEILSRYPDSGENRWYSAKAAEELQGYFSGALTEFSLPLDLEQLSCFGKAVSSYVAGIGYGEVRTYTEVAAAAGSPRAARAVGSVMAANRLPVIIPCHRVVSSDGSMCGYSAPGGVSTKRLLLEMEGVMFSSFGRVKRGE
ncbi:MAG TPA: methylated-DNA--[protein]-cysteine S-methyltransferase [Geobacteraceae bacterium]|nr:methylated-DNA--[protein]-cysteine S-methyltransferase [Geobacteraceae bacterium]